MELPEWLERAAPSQLGIFLGKTASPRKAGLFIRGLCRAFPEVFTDHRNRAALDAADGFEAGEVAEADLLAAVRVIEDRERELQAGFTAWYEDRTVDVESLRREAGPARIARETASRGYYPEVLSALRQAVLERGLGGGGGPRKNPIARAMRPLFLEHFGDIHNPVALDPQWLTSTVVALARGIYAERAFDRMPILADALQDAGCDSETVLNHCRGPGPHARGCWVVDLLLGKG